MKDTKGLNTGGSENRADQGRKGSETGEECGLGGNEGSMEFGWRRGSVKKEWNLNKGITKGESDKISMVQDKSEVSERIRGEDRNRTQHIISGLFLQLHHVTHQFI